MPLRRPTIARPAIFVDRDGVIIENRANYVKTWAEVQFLPGTFAALRRVARSAFALVIFTNQSAVGRGIITLAQALEINRRVVAEIVAEGGRIDGCYLCPHHPAEGCDCRKPAPGMLLRAAAELGLDLAHSYAIGDAASDLQAAKAAGVQGMLVLTGRGREQAPFLREQGLSSCPVVADLGAAIDLILGTEGTDGGSEP